MTPTPRERSHALPKIPLDDPRVLALAKARQQFAHKCSFLPTWEELTDEDREAGLPAARNYLEAGIDAGLFPAVGLEDLKTIATTSRSTTNLIS